MSYAPDETAVLHALNVAAHWHELLGLPAFAHLDAELGGAILAEAARYGTDILGPTNAVADREGCKLQAGRVTVPPALRGAYDRLVEGGWLSIDQPEENGGQALPITLNTAIFEIFSGANAAFMMIACSTRAAAHLLHEHADDVRGRAIAAELAAGTATATIAISEPQAGTDVRALRTQAVLSKDGSWRLSGSKIWISNGDQDYTHQCYHIVLARTIEDGKGGLTLFVAPRWIDTPERWNGVNVVGIEHKMGLHGSPTCQLELDGAVGWRIGAHGEGLRRMFTMMNIMRLDVAIQSVGICQAAAQSAIAYAAGRKQGGDPSKTIVQFPDVRRMLDEMRSIADGSRGFLYHVALQLDLLRHAASPEARAAAAAVSQFLLPVAKAWISDQAVRVSSLGIQVLGGYGYVMDFGVEQLLRDSRVMPIYEGANGVQAQDLVMRKLRKQETDGFGHWTEQIRQDLDRAPAALADLFRPRFDQMIRAAAQLRAASPAEAEAGATQFLQIAGTIAAGWIWLRLAGAAAPSAEELRLARFYMLHLLPEADLAWGRLQVAAACAA
jgi:alkylation response protein AidB-like acyl-CoA dehydrogenase